MFLASVTMVRKEVVTVDGTLAGVAAIISASAVGSVQLVKAYVMLTDHNDARSARRKPSP